MDIYLQKYAVCTLTDSWSVGGLVGISWLADWMGGRMDT